MPDISVIGLGLMGTALARAIKRAGHDLVVWNRSPGKMEPFRKDGVSCAESFASAVEASPVILICIDNYTVTRALLEGVSARQMLSGKTVVQLSSSTPKEAADAADWAQMRGAFYLDGAILAGPSDIGTAAATILLSGDRTAYDRSRDLLECLGQDTVRYLGENVRAASALDLAWLMSRYGTFLAAIHSANICQSEGVGVEEFIALVPDNPSLQHHAQTIRDEGYDDFTASLRVWGEALHHIQQQGTDAGINTEIPDFIGGLFDRAVAAGLSETNVMSLKKILTSPT